MLATDDDTAQGDSIVYNITNHYYVGGDTGDAPASCFSEPAFAISGGGQIMLLRSVEGCVLYDSGTALVYRMNVSATDTSGLSDTANVTVTVVDANSKPSIDDVSVSVSESASIGDVVTTFVATDADGDDLTYALQTSGTVPFSLDASSGELTISTALDYETTATYTVTVVVTDSGKGNLEDTATATLTVTDADEAPVLAFGATLTIPENTVEEYNISDTALGLSSSRSKRFAATDEDAGDLSAISYTLWAHDSETTSRFALNTVTSTLTGQTEAVVYYKGSTYGALDYESRSVYRFCVNATDTAGLTASVCSSVTVADVNEPPILPTNLVFNVSESDSVETYLGMITASDPEGDDVEFSVLNDADTYAYLKASSGTSSAEVRLLDLVDYEEVQSFDIVVHAQETSTSDALWANTTITVLVIDVDDISITSMSFAAGMQSGLHTSGGDTVTIYGDNFGDMYVEATVSATYASGDGVVYEATACGVTTLNTVITCSSVPGVGSGHVWTLYVTSITGTVWAKTAASDITTSYEAPALELVEHATAMPTTGGVNVTLTGTNFGPAFGFSSNATYESGEELLGDVATVYYAQKQADLSVVGNRYECANARVAKAHSTVVCVTEEGVGRELYWMIVVGIKPHSHPVQHALESGSHLNGSYATPEVTNVTSGGSPLTTAGGETVKVLGTNFGPSGTTIDHVWYGGNRGKYAAESCSITTAHTTIECRSVAGVGHSLNFWAAVGNASSATFESSVSYKKPVATAVSGSGAYKGSTSGRALENFKLLVLF